MLRLLRCRFWKSDPSRGPPMPSPASGSGGNSILMTLAPQSASWRTQVGPERTRVRSRTVNRSSAREALGNGIYWHPVEASLMARRAPGGPTFPDIPRIVHRGTDLSRASRYPLWCRLAGGRPNLLRTPIMPFPNITKLEPPAAGIAARRRDHGGAGAGAPAPRPGAADRATAGSTARQRIAAVAGRRGDRAHRGHRRRQARLYGDRRNALAVRPIGRALGRDLLHRLCRQGRRRHEPPDHLRVQRRAGRRLGVPQPGRGRPAHRRVRASTAATARRRASSTIPIPGSASPIW